MLDRTRVLLYNSYTMESVTMRFWKKTRDTLRMLHALTGESMSAIVDRLVTAELERVKREQDGER